MAMPITDRSSRPKLDGLQVLPRFSVRKTPAPSVPARARPSRAQSGDGATAVTDWRAPQNSCSIHEAPASVETQSPALRVPTKTVRSVANAGESATTSMKGLRSPELALAHETPP